MFQNFLKIIIFFVLITSQAHARKLENLFDDWHVLSTIQDSNKVCYIASIPKNEEGSYKKRSEPYLLVSLFNERKPEISVSSGYEYKPGAAVEIVIGESKFRLKKIQGERAWAENEELDMSLVAAMKRGNSLKARGTSTVGTYSIDTYSLKGFTKAYNKMVQLCTEIEEEKAEAEEDGGDDEYYEDEEGDM